MKKENNFDLRQSILLQEGSEKFELKLKKQIVVFTTKKAKVLFLKVTSLAGQDSKKIKSKM